jgi:hypothetical protein
MSKWVLGEEPDRLNISTVNQHNEMSRCPEFMRGGFRLFSRVVLVSHVWYNPAMLALLA